MALVHSSREWDRQVERSRDQHERVFKDNGRPDPWDGLTSSFVPAPDDAPDNPVISYLRSVLRADSVLLDVGAGAGRLSVPASRLCKTVLAVEPSPAMAAELKLQRDRRGIDNIDIRTVRWEEDDPAPVDVVLMSHVLYGVVPITPFVEKAMAIAGDAVIAVLGQSPPGGYYHPLWPAVHGVERIVAPGARYFEKLLIGRGQVPEMIHLPEIRAVNFRDRDEAIARSARRLRVKVGTPAHDRLEHAVDSALVDSEDGTCHFRWRKPTASLLFRWPADTGLR
ncbi:MAG: methyltransferase [Dehalococcoidia bacterium]|nr:methyltransferase [Dehalococcoidia bacterium]